ncbi:MAG: hypothetical protein RIT02_2604 [Planctomycetota bacterium]
MGNDKGFSPGDGFCPRRHPWSRRWPKPKGIVLQGWHRTGVGCPPPFGSASLPPSRSTLGGRGSCRAAGFNRHASSSAQQELRPPEGPRLPPNRGSERPCKQFGSAGASPSRRAQHPSLCHLHLHTGFRVDPFFRALRLCHATASAADCNHASRES